MSITSVPFFIFFALSLGVYYLLPKSWRWVGLLLSSAGFFALSSAPVTAVYLLGGSAATGLCAIWIGKSRNAQRTGTAKLALTVGLIIDFGILAVLKYANFFVSNVNFAFSLFEVKGSVRPLSLLAPIGISFYTLQAAGFLLDVYWGISQPQGNLLKTTLFVGYWPQLTSGPIARYGRMEGELFEGHGFSSQGVAFGLQRMLWGLFKKLVLSSRLGIIVDTIYADTAAYSGFYIWVAAALFMFQLYTDFSGCMDIIIGASECYGVTLPENFRTPFFSRSVQEYWQRWHITLGEWLKDYILYPVMRSGLWRAMTKKLRAKGLKKAAKQLPSYLGSLVVWLLIGLWHGGSWKYILGMGLWFWALITLGQVFEPAFKKVRAALRVNTDSFGWHLFQSLRVFILAAVGNMFFRLESFTAALGTMRAGLKLSNPEIFVTGKLYELGLDRTNFLLMVAGLLVLLIVSALQERGSVRKAIARQNIVFRWALWYALLFAILIFGLYGPGYEASSFIYERF